jgi:anti-sigma factor RsiW
MPELTDTDYELISAYLDDMLTSPERSQFEARLKQDAALRQELHAIRQTVALVERLPVVKAPRDFTLTPAQVSDDDDVDRTLIAIEVPSRPSRMLTIISVMSAAAAILLIFAGFVLLFPGTQGDTLMQSLDVAVQPTSTFAPTATTTAGLAQEAAPAVTEEPQAEALEFAEVEEEEAAGDDGIIAQRSEPAGDEPLPPFASPPPAADMASGAAPMAAPAEDAAVEVTAIITEVEEMAFDEMPQDAETMVFEAQAVTDDNMTQTAAVELDVFADDEAVGAQGPEAAVAQASPTAAAVAEAELAVAPEEQTEERTPLARGDALGILAILGGLGLTVIAAVSIWLSRRRAI